MKTPIDDYIRNHPTIVERILIDRKRRQQLAQIRFREKHPDRVRLHWQNRNKKRNHKVVIPSYIKRAWSLISEELRHD